MGRAFSPCDLLATNPGALPQAGMATGLWPSISRPMQMLPTASSLRCVKEIPLRPSPRRVNEIPLPPLAEQRRIVAELDAEAAQMETVRALIPKFETKIQRVLDRVWGTATE